MCSLGALSCVCGVLGHLAPVHRCAYSVRCVGRAVFWATWLLFTGVLPRCVVLRVRCPGALGSYSLVCSIGASCCVCGPLGHLAPVQRCVCSAYCVAYAVSWATWLLFTDVPPSCVVLRVRCPGPLGSCSPVCPLGALCWVCGVLGHLAPIDRCARLSVVLHVRCSGPLGPCSAVCSLGALCCVCGVLGHLTPVHRCARPVCCAVCAVSLVTWLLFTGAQARCVSLGLRCPGPRVSCPPVCSLAALCCLCGVLGHLAPVDRCARSLRGVACAVSWATWLLFTGVPARCLVLCVRCPGPLGVLGCVCRVVGHLAPVHRCDHSVRCFACAVSWAT